MIEFQFQLETFDICNINKFPVVENSVHAQKFAKQIFFLMFKSLINVKLISSFNKNEINASIHFKWT